MTEAQRRLIDVIRAYGGAPGEQGAEYWPVVNDWVRDRGPAGRLALRNINRTVEALIKAGQITIDQDGLFHLCDTMLRS